jgi:hypothetical protein
VGLRELIFVVGVDGLGEEGVGILCAQVARRENEQE